MCPLPIYKIRCNVYNKTIEKNGTAQRAERKIAMSIHEAIRNVMVSTGRLSPKDRMEIHHIEAGVSDIARVEVYAYHGRRKKPFVYWNLCVDRVRELVYWDHSTFYYI